MTDLFSPVQLGSLELSNRIVMAPMTRNRAPQGIPTELMAEYYRQRATAGLIITEGAQISEQGIGYPATPGIHADEQIKGWQVVTNVVHRAGGHIFLSALALWPNFTSGLSRGLQTRRTICDCGRRSGVYV